MIYTILKTTYIKLSPKKVIYRDYNNWSQVHYEDELRQHLVSAHSSVYENFESIFTKKEQIARNCEKIAKRSKREEDVRKYKDQRNLVVKLNVQAKKQHFLWIQSKTIDNEKNSGRPLNLCSQIESYV